ncbi:MAG: GntR family transcriptional regulator [Eubacteriales bacterium]|nr:GntR family transcriptional regulator [Eubacteriales bacterium]
MNMNLKDVAYETIKQKIIFCEYKPGMLLSEAQLMQEIDASRTPVREALNKLEQEGFVQIIPKKGTVVTALSLSEVNMTFEARLILEPYILEHYIQFIDKGKLAGIREMIQSQITSLNGDSVGTAVYPEFCDSDDLLHRTITDAFTNKYLNSSLAHIYDQNMRIRLLAGPSIWERHKEAAIEHLELIDYILMEEKTKASEAAVIHLQHSKEAAIRSLLNGDMPIC